MRDIPCCREAYEDAIYDLYKEMGVSKEKAVDRVYEALFLADGPFLQGNDSFLRKIGPLTYILEENYDKHGYDPDDLAIQQKWYVYNVAGKEDGKIKLSPNTFGMTNQELYDTVDAAEFCQLKFLYDSLLLAKKGIKKLLETKIQEMV